MDNEGTNLERGISEDIKKDLRMMRGIIKCNRINNCVIKYFTNLVDFLSSYGLLVDKMFGDCCFSLMRCLGLVNNFDYRQQYMKNDVRKYFGQQSHISNFLESHFGPNFRSTAGFAARLSGNAAKPNCQSVNNIFLNFKKKKCLLPIEILR